MNRFPHLLPTIAVSVLAAGCYLPPGTNALVGKAEATVFAELGKPSAEWPGNYGLSLADWTKRFTGEIKTKKFAKPGGEIYVSFEKRNGIWYVICNDWLRKGAQF